MPPLPPSQGLNSRLGELSTASFHAALYLADIAPLDSWYAPPSAYELQALWDALRDLFRAHGPAIMGLLGARARARGRGYPGQGDMMAILRSLTLHCAPLESYIQPGITPASLRSQIPPLDEPIASLLAAPPFQPFGPTDAKVLAMARWFKGDYMKWADPILCSLCSSPTTPTGSSQPTAQETADGGGRVELHTCQSASCGAVNRFVRYSQVRTLVREKRGRCGEWAHLFYAFLRAAEVEARYVWNSEDHVWNEYWSPALGHWVHVDSCEAASNKPLLYARGWGKKQSFCLAFGPQGAEDVTRAYVDDWPACLRRRAARGWSEYSLRLSLLTQTIRLRAALSQDVRDTLAAQDRSQKVWIQDDALRIREAERDELGGRISGTADWRAARQELGLPQINKPRFTKGRSLVNDWTFFGNARKSPPATTNTTTRSAALLTDGPGQTSGMFSTSTIPQSTSFRVELKFRLEAPPGAGEADGIALVFSSEAKLGEAGFGMGYSGLGGLGDFAVEIDTYRTQDHADDPPTPHISLHSPPHAHHRNSLSCTPPNAIPFLSNGEAYTLEVVYTASDRRVTAFLHTPEGEDLGLWQVVLPPGEGREWYVGVTGACGGLWQRQEILLIAVDEIDI